MKKIILLLICITTLGLVSCKKETIVKTTPNRTIVFDVQPSEWKLTTDGLSYFVELNNIPEIDDYSVQNEGTLVYISYPNSTGAYTSYIQMPFVYNIDAYSYEVYKGGVRIDIQSSDNQDTTPLKPSTKVKIKVVIVASENIT